MTPVPDYLVVGHVTQDLMPGGGFRAGGTATYSALAALRLGLKAAVLTSAVPSYAPLSETDIWVTSVPAQHNTQFENRYVEGERQQYLRAVAETLRPGHLPDDWRQARLVHLGPVAQEVDPALAACFPSSLLGLTPQGWLRRWDAEGRVYPTTWQGAEALVARADVVVLSPEDLGHDLAALPRLRQQARLMVLTLGVQGCEVYHQGQARRFPAYDVDVVDPTGAGDVFATAFLVRLSETGDADAAAQYANCVASFVIEGPGAEYLPTREQVEQRLRYGLLRP